MPTAMVVFVLAFALMPIDDYRRGFQADGGWANDEDGAGQPEAAMNENTGVGREGQGAKRDEPREDERSHMTSSVRE